MSLVFGARINRRCCCLPIDSDCRARIKSFSGMSVSCCNSSYVNRSRLLNRSRTHICRATKSTNYSRSCRPKMGDISHYLIRWHLQNMFSGGCRPGHDRRTWTGAILAAGHVTFDAVKHRIDKSGSCNNRTLIKNCLQSRFNWSLT